MSIDTSEFKEWMEHKVTKSLFNILKLMRDEIEVDMVSNSIIMSTDCQKILVRLSGFREGLDTILDITNEDLNDGDDDETIDKASGTQSVGEVEED